MKEKEEEFMFEVGDIIRLKRDIHYYRKGLIAKVLEVNVDWIDGSDLKVKILDDKSFGSFDGAEVYAYSKEFTLYKEERFRGIRAYVVRGINV